MEHFKWSDDYKLGISVIDQQHKILVSIMVRTLLCILHSFSDTSVNIGTKHHVSAQKVLDRLTDYAKFHFSTEETFFKKFHYEEAKGHIAAHNKFKRKILGFKRKDLRGDSDVCLEAYGFLQLWFVDHLIGFDRKYVDCFHEHGL